ncbi:hypothetical protein QQX98_004992 [Neonectria punicea]|uniref:Uncharacterized protein n=1 Tax=Neonectria punicea TaxID=979145 RepID=A0ABR1H6P6_9HYPO
MGRPRSNSAFQRSLSSPFPEGIHHQALEQHSSVFPNNTEASPHRQGLPPWNRAFDAVYHKYPQGHHAVSKETKFQDALNEFFKDHNHERTKSRYFDLPDAIRLRICRFVLAPHRGQKPIRLNRSSFNRDCWRSDDFQSPSTALLPLFPYFEASFGFRADLLITLLLDTTLHVTFSPYVGPRVSPLATTWLNTYGKYAQRLAVEVDMTRLSCGPWPEGVTLLPGIEHIEALLHKFVESQLRRDTSRPLDSLVLLCRRFYGRRYNVQSTKSITGRSSEASSYSRLSQRSEPTSPIEGMREASPALERALSASPVRQQALRYSHADDAANAWPVGRDGIETPDPKQTETKTQTSSYLLDQADYCPDSYLVMCDHLLRLRGRINSLRICGFSACYAHGFIETMFPSARTDPRRHSYRVAPSTIWPRLSGQKSYIDLVDGYLTLDDHEPAQNADSNGAFAAWEGCVQLPPPVLDVDENPSLPPIVTALQMLRSRALESSIKIQVLEDPSNAKIIGDVTGFDKKKIMRLLDIYGKAKAKRKRTFSKEISTTL